MSATPTRLSAAVFAAKAMLLCAQRSATDLLHPVPLHTLSPDRCLPGASVRSITSLWTDTASSEQWYQQGKVTNLQRAAERLHGCVIPAGSIFSFWRQVGRASARRGFRPGRMLQEGCVIPSVGGGLCQLSNALYQVALDGGCEILERHAHSRTVPGSATAGGRDATVAWNYVDLRFRPRSALQLRVEVTAEHLVVSLHGLLNAPDLQLATLPALAPVIGPQHACGTCGRAECFRNHAVPRS